ncbi:hypothetical protein SUGI_0757220 [Cryptomeria japonica]|nr:hypothetical protein SUGI_0757220 [Cryptomeria japonica]
MMTMVSFPGSCSTSLITTSDHLTHGNRIYILWTSQVHGFGSFQLTLGPLLQLDFIFLIGNVTLSRAFT